MKQDIRQLVEPYLRKVRGDGIRAILVRGAGGAFAVNALGAGANFGAQVLLARILGAESFGAYVYALTWMFMLSLLGKIGFDTASLRFVSVYNGQAQWGLLRGYLRRGNQIVLAASTLLALASAGALWLLWGRLDTELAGAFLVACLLLPLNALLEVRASFLQALKRVVPARAPQMVLRPLLLAGGLVAFSWQPLGAPAAMAVNVAATAGTLLLTGLFLRRALPSLDAPARYLTRTWGQVGRSLLLVSGLVLVLHQTDIFLVGAFLGTTEAGIYYTASRVATLTVFAMIAINTIAAPMFSEFYSQDRMAELQRVVTLAARGILAFSLPVTLAIFVWGEQVLALFGPDFTQAYWALVILTLGQLYNVATGVVGFLMSMTGHQREVARVYAASAVLNAGLNACLIPIWGIEGSAIATTTTTVIWNTILVVYVWKRLGLRATAI